MEKVYLLINDYASKWRKYLPRAEYEKEFGSVTDDELILHNTQVAENHEFLMDVVCKFNELVPGEIVSKDSYETVDGKLKMKLELFTKEEGTDKLTPFIVTDEQRELVHQIIDAVEDFVEQDFISIF